MYVSMVVLYVFLFFFQKSDPAGLLVMERCAVELDLNEQQNFSFVIGIAIYIITVMFLNFWTPENFAVINLKFK